ncbi:hypothetical protein KUL17_36980 [Alteromonas sp. KUL17]|uniref:hypothetical protein n=1 Tax=Alteromonas sp. KUL17 TaxID=2480796 RepID=UPI001037297A|nr:hypothetical protein [Alteromonas sp. KUL17]TAP20666.1 hypothetical protein KUL49_18445 [Alteromonas sp. KUL17]GEA04801.1 hypothetical protein KUL17_36980 [Alteromonas sp. KUL17]
MITLYRAFKEIEGELEVKIQEASSELSVTQRELVRSDIASRAGVSESNFRKGRKVPERLMEEIEHANARLRTIYNNKMLKRSSGKHKSKSELEAEIKRLSNTVKKLENEKYQEFFRQIIDSQLLENQKNLAERNEALKLRVRELESMVSNLRTKNSDLLKMINN